MSEIENRDFEYYLKEGKKLLFDYENQKDALNLYTKLFIPNQYYYTKSRLFFRFIFLWKKYVKSS